MAKKFYVLNTEAQVQAGAEKYRLVQGRELDVLVKTKEWREKEFIFQKQLNGDVVGIEVPASQKKECKAEKDRVRYLKKTAKELDISVTSLNVIEQAEDCGSGEDVIADESADVEQQIFAKEEIATLKQALNSLTDEEFDLVRKLYLKESNQSVCDLANEMGLSHQAISKRKKAILAKLKKFFD